MCVKKASSTVILLLLRSGPPRPCFAAPHSFPTTCSQKYNKTMVPRHPLDHFRYFSIHLTTPILNEIYIFRMHVHQLVVPKPLSIDNSAPNKANSMNNAFRAFGFDVSRSEVAAPVQRPRDKGPPFLNRLAAMYYCQCFGLWTYIWVAILCICYAYPLLLIPATLYAFYAVGPGSRAPREGNWPTPLRHWTVWRALAGYFPEARLHKTAELSPDRSYIFGYHPHGQLAFGMWLTFGSTVMGFDRLFPGIEARVTTLNINFTAPFLREYLLLHGTCSVSRDAIVNILKRGKSVAIAVGGGLESLIALPGRYDLVLHRRRGFVRCALMAGSPLVPCLGFGEPDTYHTANSLPFNSPPRRIQRFLVKKLGFTMPLVLGKGLLLPWGLLPYPVPLNVVIGAPIEVPKCEGSPGDAQFEATVDKYHALYVAALKGLYADHREKFAKGAADMTLAE